MLFQTAWAFRQSGTAIIVLFMASVELEVLGYIETSENISGKHKSNWTAPICHFNPESLKGCRTKDTITIYWYINNTNLNFILPAFLHFILIHWIGKFQ